MPDIQQLTDEEKQNRLAEINKELARRQQAQDSADVLSPSGKELRLNRINAELAKRGIQPAPPKRVMSPVEEYEDAKEFVKLAEDPKTDGLEFSEIRPYQKEIVENEVVVGEGDNEFRFIDVMKDLKRFDKAVQILGPIGASYGIGQAGRISNSVKIANAKIGDPVKISFFEPFTDKGGGFVTVTKDMQDEANAFLERMSKDAENVQNLTMGGKFAHALIQAPSFLFEFFITRGAFTAGKKAAEKTAVKLLGETAERGVRKYAVRAASAGFGTAVRTGVNIPRVLEGAGVKLTEGLAVTDSGAWHFTAMEKTPWSALASSFTDLYIENLTEIAGKSLGEGAKYVGKGIGSKFPVIGEFTKELGEKWVSNKAGRTMAEFLKATNSKVGFDGVLEEMGEEELARILRAATGKDEWSEIIPEWEDLLVEAGLFTTIGGANLAATQIFRKPAPRIKAVEEKGVILRYELDPEVTVNKLGSPEYIPLFESAKNRALADMEKENALDFLNERVGKKQKPPTSGGQPDESQPTPQGKDITNLSEAEFDEATSNVFADMETERISRIINASNHAKALAGNAYESGVETIKDYTGWAAMGVARAEDALGFMGETGKKVQKDLREISHRTAMNVGVTQQNIKPWLKNTTKSERETIAKLIDNAIPRAGQPQRLLQRADAIKAELDAIQEQAQKVGLRKGELSGRAFPQVLNKEGKALIEEWEKEGFRSPGAVAWAQEQVENGKFESEEDAILALRDWRRRTLIGKEGYLQGQRTLDIGNEYREWNLDKILQGTIETSWEKIEAARQWGTIETNKKNEIPYKQIALDIEKIRGDVGFSQADQVESYIRAQFGMTSPDPKIAKIARTARQAQFVGKLAFSPLTISRNILDRYAKGLAIGSIQTNLRASIKYPTVVNYWMESAKKIEDEMIRRGAVLGHGHLTEGVTTAEGIVPLAAKPFGSSERGNQTYIALVKKIQLESDVKRLMEFDGEKGSVSKMFNRMESIVGNSQKQTRNRLLSDLTNEQLADAMTKGEISDDVMSEVLHRTVTDSAFPLTLASKRMWWGRRPMLQVATQFKVWSADQTRFIYKDVLKYGIQTGDYSRLGRFILGTWIMGELYNIARDEIQNKDESVLSKLKGGTRTEIALAMANNMVDGGGLGVLADFTYGIGDWAAGPTINTIAKAIDIPIESSGVGTVPQATKKFLMGDVPALKQAQGIMDTADRRFFDEEKTNLTGSYARWKNRSFDFRKKNGEQIGDSWFYRALKGTPSKRMSDRSLPLELISRQVLVGDYKDAANHIKFMMSKTPVEETQKAVQSLEQSMKNNSPFGNIAQKDIVRFLSQYDVDEAADGMDLQSKWLEGYAKSMDIAFKELEAEGWKDDIKERAMAYKKEMEPKIKQWKSFSKELKSEMKRRKADRRGD